ncbi:hypothetical protein A4R26_28540 [Niastella populi]|uniref:Uncharacterized protein n=1 Tax=Niastella populi TaxID=550983 RepID=A0A1V9F2W8_9BACT|nr:hypothetical protein A4R26_28540 [Niastella populi]
MLISWFFIIPGLMPARVLALNNVQDYRIRMLVIRVMEIINISTYRMRVIVIKKKQQAKERYLYS